MQETQTELNPWDSPNYQRTRDNQAQTAVNSSLTAAGLLTANHQMSERALTADHQVLEERSLTSEHQMGDRSETDDLSMTTNKDLTSFPAEKLLTTELEKAEEWPNMENIGQESVIGKGSRQKK